MDSRVQEVLRELDGSWCAPPCVSQLAARVGLRPSRLAHLFRREVHTSIREYVRIRRMRRAAELLTQSHERVSAIAFAVGYNDVSNFNHVFKKYFGASPRVYRTGVGNTSKPHPVRPETRIARASGPWMQHGRSVGCDVS